MNDQQLREIVLRNLCQVAPDVDPADLDPHQPFRDQFDFDSMDQLNFTIALHRELAIDIPEGDYPRMSSLEGCIDYLRKRLKAEQSAPSALAEKPQGG